MEIELRPKGNYLLIFKDGKPFEDLSISVIEKGLLDKYGNIIIGHNKWIINVTDGLYFIDVYNDK